MIKQAFPGRELPENEREAVRQMLHYLRLEGRLPGLKNGHKREVFIKALDEALKACSGLALRDVMVREKTDRLVLYRTFCWERYRNAFPFDSSERLCREFGCPQDPSTVRSMLLKLPWRLRCDADAAREYDDLCNEIDAIINKPYV